MLAFLFRNDCPLQFLYISFLKFALITLTIKINICTSQSQGLIPVEIGHNVTLKCISSHKNITWKFYNTSIIETNSRYILSLHEAKIQENKNEIVEKTLWEHFLTIVFVRIIDKGIYTCESSNNGSQKFTIQPYMLPKVVDSSSTIVKQKIGHSVTLFCCFEFILYNNPLKYFKWLKDETSFQFLDNSAKLHEINTTLSNFTIEFTEVYKKENGSYSCVAYAESGKEVARKDIDLLVMDVPQVYIEYVKAVGASKIFLNWTVNDGNDPIQKYFIQYTTENSSSFDYYNHVIAGKNMSYVLQDFQPNTSYILRISAKNSIGDGVPYQYPQQIRTLDKDPIFVPKVKTTGSTASTITIGWDPPPLELLDYIQYYELVVFEGGDNPRLVEEVIYQQNSRNLPYMFDNLRTATEYEFKVRACSYLTRLCGPWSDSVNGTTMDGVATKPTDLQVICTFQNNSRLNSVIVSWNVPLNPNGKIVSYLINLNGESTFKLNGKIHSETWGPKIRRVDEPNHKTIYDGVNPNTNYTVAVSAITRHRKIGETATEKCSMPVSTPDTINRILWTKIKTADNKYILKLFIPKISERNGPICCYRLFLVKLAPYENDLPAPDKLKISTYSEVHSPNNTSGGAYIAEMFSAENFNSEVILGDGKRFFNSQKDNSIDFDANCLKCLKGQILPENNSETKRKEESEDSKKTLETLSLNQNQGNNSANISNTQFQKKRQRRYTFLMTELIGSESVVDNFHQVLKKTNRKKRNENSEEINHGRFGIYDGEIDGSSNYTGFLEVIVLDRGKLLKAYSNYFETITPGSTLEHVDNVDSVTIALNILIQVVSALIGIVLVLLFVLCLFHQYNVKSSGHGNETMGLGGFVRTFFSNDRRNRRTYGNTANNKSSDKGPIQKSNLLIAYKNRHKDTDYGFLREYEVLPSRFFDRTTKNSDLKENSFKNRYPDIKAYDQTRVKLTSVNGIQGSDYINANFVIGYKERKKFICAQGPMESTMNDFWRMIWEQHLEVIVMLTNLEEYNKSKCAKYWPEKVSDFKIFNDITVKFVGEKRFDDYLSRKLDIYRRSYGNEEEEETRNITQYQYLVWKDFMAPEHPQGIIKFIRQINAVYSVQRGPLLVHCSAGVGRTGTLVALDSLVQQLDEENQVSIYNTVCDLRHQRNFLVQSLKQYIFLYRALLDYAQYGNTELPLASLTTTIENLKSKPIDCKEKSKLEIEFEKILAPVDENNKSYSFGATPENVTKNRSETVIPFDHNRVILSSVPLKIDSTYINASFIEGYFNFDTYIITQDPMENTIADFWRMISEQSISTLVMISEIGDGPRKCPRYWADNEIQYDHIGVKYLQSENCPYYTRREFEVVNYRTEDLVKVTQFQYNGWPTVEGEVPEVCRGIIEVVDQAQSHYAEQVSECKSPMVVHCSLGTDRSSIFVAMCILVQQLRTEKSVDICTTTRKLRSQRQGLINTYAQYEFLHRAIVNYADLHKLGTD